MMIDSADWWTVYAAGWRTAMRMGETLVAANAVVDSRSGTIRAAVSHPLTADYVELGRMAPEKVEAFGKAGVSIARDLDTIQSESIAHVRHLAAIMARGGVPTVADVRTMTARGDRMARRSLGAFGRALSPVHATATANAKRLRKSG